MRSDKQVNRQSMRAFIAGISIALSACSTWQAGDPANRQRTALPDSLAAPFDYQTIQAGLSARTSLATERQYSRYRYRLKARFIQDGETRAQDIVIEHYRTDIAYGPAIMLLPIFGGRYVLSGYYAAALAEAGYDVYLVHRVNDLRDRICLEPDKALVEMTTRHRLVLDWMAERHNGIGVFGLSAGAIKGALLTAVDPRIDAAVLALGGSDIATICAQSDDGRISRNRERIIAAGVDRRGFTAFVNSHHALRIDDYARYIASDTVLQVIAEHDTTVPTATQWQLHEALGRPRALVLATGHLGSALHLTTLEQAAIRFFNQHIKQP